MTKKLLSILLMGSFAAFATDPYLDGDELQKNASELDRAIYNGYGAAHEVNLKGSLDLSELRKAYALRTIEKDVMPDITHLQLKAYVQSGDATFTVEKDGESFVFSADKTILMTQYSDRVVSASTPSFSGLNDLTHPVDANGRIKVHYTYYIGLYLHRGYYPINLILHTPDNVFKEKIKLNLINQVDILSKAAKKLNKANNIHESDSVERYRHLNQVIKTERNEILNLIETGQFELAQKKIDTQQFNFTQSIKNIVDFQG